MVKRRIKPISPAARVLAAMTLARRENGPPVVSVARTHPSIHPLAVGGLQRPDGVLLRDGRLIEGAVLDEEGFVLLKHQIWPEGDWDTWLITGGRGASKTYPGSYYCRKHLKLYGRGARVGVLAPSIPLARMTNMNGVSGVITLFGREFPRVLQAYREAWHENGGYIYFFGAESVDSPHGPEFSLLWVDEGALIAASIFRNVEPTLRLCPAPGVEPRMIITTTPEMAGLGLIKEIRDAPGTVHTRGETKDNPFTSQKSKDRLYRKHVGTMFEPIMLKGEISEFHPNAWWKQADIDKDRRPKPLALKRVVVSIDPAKEQEAKNRKASSDTGIAVMGLGFDEELYLLESVRLEAVAPDVWASRAVALFDLFKADLIVAEKNNGGAMVQAVIGHVRANLPYKAVDATRGKEIRAEPVACLYQQHRVHHCGSFPHLEATMNFFPQKQDKIDELEAMVWAVTELAGLDLGDLVAETFTEEGLQEFLNTDDDDNFPMTGTFTAEETRLHA